MASRIPLVAALAFTPLAVLSLLAQPPQRDNVKPSETGAMPPKTWVDKDTGHRVWRVSDEPNSGRSTSTSTPTPLTTNPWSITRPKASACSTSPP